LLIAADSKLRDSVKALQLSKKAVLLDPESVLAWQVLGWAYYRNGAYRESVEALEKSCKLQDGTGDLGQWFVLAMAYWQLGEKEQARKWYEDAVKQLPNNGPDMHRLHAEAETLIAGKRN
jgi:tetratricopeptide (TPR) repeat protein